LIKSREECLSPSLPQQRSTSYPPEYTLALIEFDTSNKLQSYLAEGAYISSPTSHIGYAIAPVDHTT
jgi:hypothetical protein